MVERAVSPNDDQDVDAACHQLTYSTVYFAQGRGNPDVEALERRKLHAQCRCSAVAMARVAIHEHADTTVCVGRERMSRPR